MTADELHSVRVGPFGRLPGRDAVIELIVTLWYLTALIGGLSLLVTLELFVRLSLF